MAADQSSFQDADEDYKSIWADISSHTLAQYETELGHEGHNQVEEITDDHETEYSGFY